MVTVAGVHVEPLGVYSKKHATLAAIPNGAQVVLPNDASNTGRSLLLLQGAGLITLRDPTNPLQTVRDVATNPKGLKFQEVEAAEEVAKQLRLRDIGGIVVIDFIDMEIKDNRRKVVEAFRSALARDKTRTQVFDISELGLVEMTRKRIGEGLLVNFADQCPNCEGRGLVIDHALLE